MAVLRRLAEGEARVVDLVALLGFGLDSVIEGLASIVVVWRFSGARQLSEDAEARARPGVSPLGIGLSLCSLVVMPLLGRAKRRLGRVLDSGATAGEGKQNLLCAYLAAAVLVGLLADAVFGLWWADPAIGLLIAGLAVREGLESWRGEDCGC